MKLIITGATGFIGKNLLKEKELKKHEVIILTNKKLKKKTKKINSNIENINKKIKQVIKFGPEILIHLAWEGIPNYGKKNSYKNYIKQKKFFKALRKVKTIKKIIITGSCFEYGILKGSPNEKKNITSMTDFSKAKIAIYRYLKNEFSKSVRIIWLRLFYVYGIGQRNDALIPYLIKNLMNGKKIYLKEPYAARDFINVKDVCNVIVNFIKINKQGIYNVGTGKSNNPVKIINYILKDIKSDSVIKFNKLKKHSNFFANIRKLRKVYFNKNISLNKGIKDLIIHCKQKKLFSSSN
jgi:nucleoside-diphosphate-sugar epimerase